LLVARYRVEVRDRDGKLVTVLEDDSKSFTMNFIKLLIASHYNQNDVPTFVIYNVAGSPLYTGYIQTPYVGVPWRIFNIDSRLLPRLLLCSSYLAGHVLMS